IDEHPGYTRAFFEHHDELDDSQKSEMRSQRREYLEMVSGIIAAGVKSGLFAKCEPRLTALGFLGMCNFAYKWYPREKGRTVEATAQALCKGFLEGLCQRGRWEAAVAIQSESEPGLDVSLGEQYYAAGYRRPEDLWTSVRKVAAR